MPDPCRSTGTAAPIGRKTLGQESAGARPQIRDGAPAPGADRGRPGQKKAQEPQHETPALLTTNRDGTQSRPIGAEDTTTAADQRSKAGPPAGDREPPHAPAQPEHKTRPDRRTGKSNGTHRPRIPQAPIRQVRSSAARREDPTTAPDRQAFENTPNAPAHGAEDRTQAGERNQPPERSGTATQGKENTEPGIGPDRPEPKRDRQQIERSSYPAKTRTPKPDYVTK